MSDRLTMREMRAIADTRAPSPDSKLERVVKVDNNTCKAYYASPTLGLTSKVIHQRTTILTFSGDGSIAITTGGWNTVTTRDRLNKFLPAGYRVCNIAGEMWLVVLNPNRHPVWDWSTAQWHKGEDFTIESDGGNVWGGEAFAIGNAPTKRNRLSINPSFYSEKHIESLRDV